MADGMMTSISAGILGAVLGGLEVATEHTGVMEFSGGSAVDGVGSSEAGVFSA